MSNTDLQSIKDRLQTVLPSLREQFGVGQMWIVGSRARGNHSKTSDLDLMVEFRHRGISLIGFCRLENDLSDALGLKVDLVERGAMNHLVEQSVAEDAILV